MDLQVLIFVGCLLINSFTASSYTDWRLGAKSSQQDPQATISYNDIKPPTLAGRQTMDQRIPPSVLSQLGGNPGSAYAQLPGHHTKKPSTGHNDMSTASSKRFWPHHNHTAKPSMESVHLHEMDSLSTLTARQLPDLAERAFLNEGHYVKPKPNSNSKPRSGGVSPRASQVQPSTTVEGRQIPLAMSTHDFQEQEHHTKKPALASRSLTGRIPTRKPDLASRSMGHHTKKPFLASRSWVSGHHTKKPNLDSRLWVSGHHTRKPNLASRSWVSGHHTKKPNLASRSWVSGHHTKKPNLASRSLAAGHPTKKPDLDSRLLVSGHHTKKPNLASRSWVSGHHTKKPNLDSRLWVSGHHTKKPNLDSRLWVSGHPTKKPNLDSRLWVSGHPTKKPNLDSKLWVSGHHTKKPNLDSRLWVSGHHTKKPYLASRSMGHPTKKPFLASRSLAARQHTKKPFLASRSLAAGHPTKKPFLASSSLAARQHTKKPFLASRSLAAGHPTKKPFLASSSLAARQHTKKPLLASRSLAAGHPTKEPFLVSRSLAARQHTKKPFLASRSMGHPTKKPFLASRSLAAADMMAEHALGLNNTEPEITDNYRNLTSKSLASRNFVQFIKHWFHGGDNKVEVEEEFDDDDDYYYVDEDDKEDDDQISFLSMLDNIKTVVADIKNLLERHFMEDNLREEKEHVEDYKEEDEEEKHIVIDVVGDTIVVKTDTEMGSGQEHDLVFDIPKDELNKGHQINTSHEGITDFPKYEDQGGLPGGGLSELDQTHQDIDDLGSDINAGGEYHDDDVHHDDDAHHEVDDVHHEVDNEHHDNDVHHEVDDVHHEVGDDDVHHEVDDEHHHDQIHHEVDDSDKDNLSPPDAYHMDGSGNEIIDEYEPSSEYTTGSQQEYDFDQGHQAEVFLDQELDAETGHHFDVGEDGMNNYEETCPECDDYDIPVHTDYEQWLEGEVGMQEDDNFLGEISSSDVDPSIPITWNFTTLPEESQDSGHGSLDDVSLDNKVDLEEISDYDHHWNWTLPEDSQEDLDQEGDYYLENYSDDFDYNTHFEFGTLQDYESGRNPLDSQILEGAPGSHPEQNLDQENQVELVFDQKQSEISLEKGDHSGLEDLEQGQHPGVLIDQVDHSQQDPVQEHPQGSPESPIIRVPLKELVPDPSLEVMAEQLKNKTKTQIKRILLDRHNAQPLYRQKMYLYDADR